jgi:hypothetical protein
MTTYSLGLMLQHTPYTGSRSFISCTCGVPYINIVIFHFIRYKHFFLIHIFINNTTYNTCTYYFFTNHVMKITCGNKIYLECLLSLSSMYQTISHDLFGSFRASFQNLFELMILIPRLAKYLNKKKVLSVIFCYHEWSADFG